MGGLDIREAHQALPEATFTGVVARALTASAGLGGRPVILRVEADDSEGDYGWIHRGRETARAKDQPLWDVDRFVKKRGRGSMKDFRDAFCNGRTDRS